MAFELALVVDHLGKEAGQHTNLGMHHRPRLSCKSSESQESLSSSITLPVFMPLDSLVTRKYERSRLVIQYIKFASTTAIKNPPEVHISALHVLYIHKGGATPATACYRTYSAASLHPWILSCLRSTHFTVPYPKVPILSPYLSFDPARLMYLLDRNLRKAT